MNEYLISARELAENAAAVIFDCRFALTDPAAGREQYESGHIPGARFIDLEQDLSRLGLPGGRHPLPDPDELTAKLRAAGVDNDSSIVCYDQNSGALAGRLWWLLRWLGHADVRLLDGGLDAWITAGLTTSTASVEAKPGNFGRREALTRMLSAEELADSRLPMLDARDAARYRGETEPFDAVAGHIPGAICAPFTDNLADGAFKSQADLKQRFRELGLADGATAICYCGSGVTATHNMLALLLAGYPEPILYAGSWSDWISDPTRPVATG